jgi:glucose-fructose oxidoreductase
MTDGIDRRDILVGIGAIAASATVPLASACAQGQKRRPVGYAIVGLGYYATQVIMPQFANCKHSRIVGLVSGDPAKAKRYAAEYRVPERSIYDYRNYDRIRDNPDIDVVYVVLPNSMHAEYTVRAAAAGKHVLCEKPMATSIADCEAMIDACRKAGKKLMIGYRSHFEPHNLHAMRLRAEGRVGRPRFVESEHGFPIGDPTQWRLKRALSGGGSLMDIGIYSVQALRYISGEEPLSVTARWSTDHKDPRFHEVEDLIHWTFTFPSGMLGGGLSSYSSGHNHIRLTGDKGWIDLEPATPYQGQKMRVGKDYNGDFVEPPAGPGVNQFVGQLDHMAECIVQNRDPIVGGDEGLRDMRIIQAIYRSASEEGRTVVI